MENKCNNCKYYSLNPNGITFLCNLLHTDYNTRDDLACTEYSFDFDRESNSGG